MDTEWCIGERYSLDFRSPVLAAKKKQNAGCGQSVPADSNLLADRDILSRTRVVLSVMFDGWGAVQIWYGESILSLASNLSALNVSKQSQDN